jgi:glycosyltransferase involved in cell wall biosynthesis
MSGLVDQVERSGIKHVTMVAWRDLDDPEAGGSELHAHRIAERWAAAGIELTMRTSQVPNAPATITRSGYRAVRRNGRYAVFPRVMLEGTAHRDRRDSALVEIWNGMPFLSPLWFQGPRLTFLHHVHAQLWDMALPPRLALIGKTYEAKIAPRFYRRSTIATLSASSRQEILDLLHLRGEHVHVVPPGVESRFSPGEAKSPTPQVLAVGRLVPVKRFDLLIRELAAAKARVPDLTATIVGEGYERSNLELLRDSLGASSWLALPGRLSEEAQLSAYRSAWLVASTSAREGWGMTLTEAAACGTPVVATDIAGHRDAVLDGVSGLLVDGEHSFSDALIELLSDAERRALLSKGAIAHAAPLSWERTAEETFALLSASHHPPSR